LPAFEKLLPKKYETKPSEKQFIDLSVFLFDKPLHSS